jgi:hypothetical protein
MWFGLILKITERMKSYTPSKEGYFTKEANSQAKFSLFSGSHPKITQAYIPQIIPKVVIYSTREGRMGRAYFWGNNSFETTCPHRIIISTSIHKLDLKA